jgi:hypothetical protein
MPDHAVNVPEKGFHKLSLDPCYAFYEESLKCGSHSHPSLVLLSQMPL